MKKFLSAILAASMVFGTGSAVCDSADYSVTQAYASSEYTEGTYDLLTYKNYGDYIEISECVSSATSVEIPSEIDGVPVTRIGVRAFFLCGSLTSITLPNNITRIGEYAFSCCDELTNITIPDSVTSIEGSVFSGCESLTSITIPNSVTSIGNSAFSGCESLASITIPDSVTSIGSSAFSGCESLTSIIIPDGVKHIVGGTFSGCSSLKSITVSEENSNYCSEKGVLFNKAMTQLIQYPIGNKKTVYTIPDSVTSIVEYAFKDCSRLTSVTIPDSVTRMVNSAFEGCSRLTSVTIPSGVTSISARAFYNCDRLERIIIENPKCEIYDLLNEGNTFPSSSTIYGYAGSTAQKYAENHGVKFALIGGIPIEPSTDPSTDKGIYGENLYYEKIDEDNDDVYDYVAIIDCNQDAVSIEIPPEIEGLPVAKIGYEAFWWCKNLKSITIPDSVKSIDDRAFLDCESLTSITIPNSVVSVGDYAFYNCESLASITLPDSITSIGIAAFYRCYSLTSITIPNGVTSIGGQAFYMCSSLTSITIPDSVTSIGANAFEDCSYLTSVTIPDSVISIGDGAFWGCEGLTSITIPESVTSISDNVFADCTSLTSVIIKNPDCEIYNFVDYLASIPSSSTIYGYTDSTAQTYAEKYGYKFVALDSKPEPSVTVWGDADENGTADMDDVVAILCAASGLSTLSEQGALNADIYQNGDGISSNDAVSLQKYLALTISELPESYLG